MVFIFKKFRSQQTLGGRHKVGQPRIKSHMLYQADVKQYRCCYFKVIWDNEGSTKFGLKKPKFKSQFTVYVNYYLGPISPLFWAVLSLPINCWMLLDWKLSEHRPCSFPTVSCLLLAHTRFSISALTFNEQAKKSSYCLFNMDFCSWKPWELPGFQVNVGNSPLIGFLLCSFSSQIHSWWLPEHLMDSNRQ